MKRPSGHDGHRRTLREVAEHIEAGRRFVARQVLERFMSAQTEAPEALCAIVFSAALAGLLDPSRQSPLDAHEFEVPDAELAELLEQHAPWMRIAGRVAAAAVARGWSAVDGGGASLGLMALCPRRGGRVVELLTQLAAGQLGIAMPERLDVVAVEPRASDLRVLLDRVASAAEALGVGGRVVVRPVCARPDALRTGDWRHARTLAGDGPLVVHATTALSEVPGEARPALFGQLRRLEAQAVVIETVDRAHLGGGLVHRFDWCWRHVAARTEALAAAGLDERDRRAIAICHLGRELEVLLSSEGAGRAIEDRATSWRDLAHGAGFPVVAPPRVPGGDDARWAGCAAAASADGIVRVVRHGLSLAAVFVAGAPPRAADVDEVEPTPGSSMVMRLDAVPQPLDVHTYLAALQTAARADRFVHDAERAFVERQARLLHIDAATLAMLPPLELVLDETAHARSAPSIEPRTARAIVRDLVFLARVDGEYHEAERTLILRVARRLGFDETWLAHVEALATVPDLIADTPSWFQEYWFLAHKS